MRAHKKSDQKSHRMSVRGMLLIYNRTQEDNDYGKVECENVLLFCDTNQNLCKDMNNFVERQAWVTHVYASQRTFSLHD